MRFVHPTLWLVCICIGIIQCKKEYSYERGAANENDSTSIELLIDAEWQFQEGTIKYNGPVDTAYLTQEDAYSVLTIRGTSNGGDERIAIILRGMSKIEKGKTYNTTREEVRFIYSNSDTIYSAIPYANGDIYVTITDIAENKVTGTFRGLAVKKDGKSYEIKEGKFSSPLKKLALSNAKGYIMLYAEESCNGPIKVKANGQLGEITKFSGLKPNCGDVGNATFNVTPGTYTWVAYCGNDSVFGKIEAKASSCTKVLISFPIKPAPTTVTEQMKTCKVSSINYTGDLFPVMSNTINTTYNGTTPEAINYSVKVPGFVFPFTYSVKKAGNQIAISHPSTNHTNYFITDAKGRVVEYYSNSKPDTLNSITPEYITYAYDNNDNLIKRTFYKDADRRPINETKFDWLNGNIIKMTQTNLITGSSLDYHYEYFDKPVKAMPFFYTEVRELLMYQSIINFGNSVQNLPKKMKIVLSPTNTYNYSFYGYVIDANNYVQSMRLGFDDSNKWISFSFQYTCV